MRCYRHQELEAVGICKNCMKGVCPECAVDLGDGLACKVDCEEMVKDVNIAWRKTIRIYTGKGSFSAGGIFSSTYIFAAMTGLLFIYFSFLITNDFGSLFFLGFGAVNLIFAYISYRNKRALTRSSRTPNNQESDSEKAA